MRRKLVALVKEKSRKESILKALSLIKGDLKPFLQAETVLIKPNFTSAFNPAASTQSEAVETILEFFENFDPNFGKKKIILAETSGEAYSRGESMKKVFIRFGFGKIFAEYSNVSFWDFSQEKEFLTVPIETIGGETKIRIPKKIFSFDYKISVTLPKTHDSVVFTGVVKNFLMGIIKPEDKSLMHGFSADYSDFQRLKTSEKIFNKLATLIIKKTPWQFNLFLNNFLPAKIKDKITGFDKDIYQKSVVCLHRNLFRVGQIIMPNLGIIDGWWGMDKDGPVYGRCRRLGIAIASTDPLVADAVGTKVIGFSPEKIAYLWLLAKTGNYKLYPKGLVGEKINSAFQKFLPHRHFRYQIGGRNTRGVGRITPRRC